MGGTCGIVRGCVFVSVGDGPVMLFFKRIMPHEFQCCTAFNCRCVFEPVGDGSDVLF